MRALAVSRLVALQTLREKKGSSYCINVENVSLLFQVLPLVFIMVGAGIGLCGYIVYASQTRESVVFKKSNKTLSQSMDLLNPKALKVSQKRKLGQPSIGGGNFKFQGSVNVN